MTMIISGTDYVLCDYVSNVSLNIILRNLYSYTMKATIIYRPQIVKESKHER